MSKFDPYEHFKVTLNQDGSLTRNIKFPFCPATDDNPTLIPRQSILSKDVTLNADKKTWMRIYYPTKLQSEESSVARLPIILYFHAGGWILCSVADSMIHEKCNLLSGEVPAIVVAVEFRLSPEHRLPAQYEDAMDAVMWIRKQVTDSDGEPWIKDYGDFSRCYLCGCSCGANIAFNTALQISELNLQPLKIAGTIMNQPFFGGKQRTRSELKLATDEFFPLPAIDLLWELALPPGADRDHRYCNPLMDGSIKDKVKQLGRCLLIGFDGDPLIDRQQEFVQMLVQQGVSVEARFDHAGFHGIDMIDARRAMAIRKLIKEFVH